MAKIKSAYELATERMVVSRYKPSENLPIDDFDMVDPYQDKKAPREFIEAWKNPNGKEEHKDVVFVDQVEKEKFLREKEKVKKEDNKMPSNIHIVEPTTYHYGFTPEIQWKGNFTSYDALGRVSRAMTFGLSNKNVKVKIDINPSRIDINESTIKELNILENQTVPPESLQIYHGIIPEELKNKNSILYTSIDEVGKVNHKILDKFREIWVHSDKDKEKIEKLTKVPIYVIPYGVDTERYNPSILPLKLNVPLNGFVFLTICKWKESKGIFKLLKSYMETFSNSDDVSLLMVVKDAPQKQIGQEFRKVRSTVTKDDNDLPHVVVYDHPIPEKNMPGLYAISNVYILVSENEQNGLTYLESGASGKSVIACECDNTSGFLKEDTCFMIKKGQNVIQQTSSFMKLAFNNPEMIKLKAEKLRKAVQSYDWETSINTMYNRILENIGDKK